MLTKKRPKTFKDILTLEYRWPKSGDRLLRPSRDWDRGVGFSRDGLSRHAHMWNGFMSAGAALVEACEQHGHERHGLVYPILYNYRHGTELAMKWITTVYGGGKGVVGGHDLWQLWKDCRAIIDATGMANGSEAVERVIKDLHHLDTKSDAFRYGWDRNGKPIKLPGGMIDLENLRDVMEGVGHFFEGADAMLGELSAAAP